MCSSGGQIAKNDEALQESQIAMNKTLNADYSTTFAEQQSILGNLKAKMDYIAANPMGYTPAQLHLATTAINENTSGAAKRALGSAAAYAATHGAPDVGGGAIGQVAGEIGSAAAQSKAQSLAQLRSESENLKQKNFWSAIQGLSSVGSELGGAGGTAIGGAGTAASTAVSAGEGALQAKQAGWGNFMGVLGGIAGLTKAASGIPGFHV